MSLKIFLMKLGKTYGNGPNKKSHIMALDLNKTKLSDIITSELPNLYENSSLRLKVEHIIRPMKPKPANEVCRIIENLLTSNKSRT